MRLKNAIHASTYIRGYPMLTLYIADAERDVSMKNLSRKEAAKILEDMKVKIEIPKAAVTQWKRNIALDMAVESLSCSESPNSSDLISRQAAIEALLEKGQRSRRYKLGDIWELNFGEIREAINAVPPAQPEVLACGSGELYEPPEPEGNSIHDLEELAEKVGSATVYDAAKEERTEEHEEMHACDSIHDIEELAKKVGVATIEEVRNEAKKDDPYKHDTDLISRRAAIDIINRIENMDPKAKGGITVNLALLPALHPEPELKGEILEAVEMLKEKYEEAKKISYINKPFEYALYHTWKEFDGRNKMTR